MVSTARRRAFGHPTGVRSSVESYAPGRRSDMTGALKLNPRELAMADEARSRLGRGLASLIGDVGGEAAHVERPRGQRKVPIEFLKPNPRNPRRTFADAELAELTESVRQHGVIQPIVAR